MTVDLVSDEQLEAMQYRFKVCSKAASPTVAAAGMDGARLVRALRDARARLMIEQEGSAAEINELTTELDSLRAENEAIRRHLMVILGKHRRYRAPAEDRFDCCAECNRGSASYVPYPCQVRIDLEAALAAPAREERDEPPKPSPLSDPDNMAFSAHKFGIAHTECWCARCESEAKARLIATGEKTRTELIGSFMHLCPDCGDKRCPRTAWHGNTCQSVSTGDEETTTDAL